jgi:hypothetical protein
MEASLNGHDDVVMLLMINGADVNCHDNVRRKNYRPASGLHSFVSTSFIQFQCVLDSNQFQFPFLYISMGKQPCWTPLQMAIRR